MSRITQDEQRAAADANAEAGEIHISGTAIALVMIAVFAAFIVAMVTK
jgi:hypothetical protein